VPVQKHTYWCAERGKGWRCLCKNTYWYKQKKGEGASACAKTHVLIYAERGSRWQCLCKNTRNNICRKREWVTVPVQKHTYRFMQKEGAGDGVCAKTHVLTYAKKGRGCQPSVNLCNLSLLTSCLQHFPIVPLLTLCVFYPCLKTPSLDTQHLLALSSRPALWHRRVL
jgi:hypothetical protein